MISVPYIRDGCEPRTWEPGCGVKIHVVDVAEGCVQGYLGINERNHTERTYGKDLGDISLLTAPRPKTTRSRVGMSTTRWNNRPDAIITEAGSAILVMT